MTPESQSLSGRSVFITGAARRIGAAIATELHAAGMNTVLHYRTSRESAQILCDTLNDRRPKSAMLCAGSLENAAACESLAQSAVSAFGELHALVNNASAFFPTPMGKTTDAEWDALFDVNLRAPFFLSQACAPELAKNQGCIINLTDIYAERPLADHPVYSASKAGLLSLTRSLARELSPNVRVNAVAPGAILWPETGESEAVQNQILSRTPLERLGNPADIAKTVLFLIQDAPFITGQVINVDGGRTVVP